MLSSALGYSKLDKESLEVLLTNLGMAEPQVGADEEKKPGLWEQFTHEKVRYLDFMKAAMYRRAGEEDCIIIGRGANIIFRCIPGTLRLRIIAPQKVRVERLRERLGVDEQHALRMIHQSDHDRPETTSISSMPILVLGGRLRPGCQHGGDISRGRPVMQWRRCLVRRHSPYHAAARSVLADLRIAQDVIIAIAYRERVNITSLDCHVQPGSGAVHRIVRHSTVLDHCLQIAEAVEGVEKVVSYVEVVEFAYYAGM